MAQELVVKIVGDATSLDRAMKKSERSAKRFGGEMETTSKKATRSFVGIGKGLVGLGAGFGAVSVLRDSVLAASDLEQQMGKTNVVFGDSAKEVEAWSKTLADSFGLSQREALTTASTLGALFAPIGLTGKQAADTSRQLTELGADLASFYNTDVQQALDALRSGLVGESEPLRKYGVLLTETRVQQQAMADTGKTNVKALTAQEKVLARIKIILRDSVVAQGDFARTSDDAAQKVKIFQANVENLKAELGEGLVPALAGAASAASDFIKAMRSDSQWNQSLLQQFQDLGEALPGPLGRFSKRHRLPFTSAEEEAPEFPLTPEPFTQATEIARRTARAARDLAKAVLEVSAGRRRANEALRELVQDRAAFVVEQATATKTLTDDLAALNKYNALLTRRMKGGHKTLELEREQFQVQQQIADVLAQQADRIKEQAEAQKAARTARQFRLLGFGPEGQDLVPGVGALKRQLASVNDVLAGSFLDTKKTRSLISHIRKVLSGGMGSVSEEVRSRIQQILADLKQQLRQSSVDVTRFQKTARGQFALAGAAGGGKGVVITGGVHLHGIQNVPQLEAALAKRKKQRARQRGSTR